MTTMYRPCQMCSGTGKLAVSGVYKETLDGMKRLCARGGYVIANRDAKWFGCSGPALSNRLVWLEIHGYAVSERYGREKRFRLPKE